MKKILSLILAVTLLFSSAFILTASALMPGDIDGDKKVTASDARLVLRASVSLTTLTNEQQTAADVDKHPGVSAADARLILRASVGLEVLHVHTFKSKVTKSATCTTDGEIQKTCDCGEVITEVIPATGHKLRGRKITKEATATEYGEAVYACGQCDYKETYVLCTHNMPSIKVNGVTQCTVSGCKGEFPSFNQLVNSLKAYGSLNYLYGFTKTVTTTEKPTVKASSIIHLALAELMEGFIKDSIEAGTVTEYSDMTQKRHVNNATYFVAGESYVSALQNGDVKSIKVSKESRIDFINSLPSSYTSTDSGAKYNLTSVKNFAPGYVYKVTVTLATENMSNSKVPQTVTPIEKIFSTSYNEGLKKNIEELNKSMAESPEMAEMMKSGIDIATDCTITYYFTADDFEPVASHYDVNMSTDTKIYTYFDNFFNKKDSPTTTTTVSSVSKQSYYYFFNNTFSF